MTAIRQRAVLTRMLLDTLAEEPQGLTSQQVYQRIPELYSVPVEWDREIFRKRDNSRVYTEPQWRNEIRWSRNTLRKDGFLDTRAPEGLWRLSYIGFDAARDPSTYSLTLEETVLLHSSRKVDSGTSPPPSSRLVDGPEMPYGTLGSGGESLLHWQLKMYLARDPSLLGLSVEARSRTEHSFLTGDRVDIIYFVPPGEILVVEVEVEGKDNLLVGLHQAIKYRALATAQAGRSLGDIGVSAALVAYDTSYEDVQEQARKYDIRLLPIERAGVAAWAGAQR